MIAKNSHNQSLSCDGSEKKKTWLIYLPARNSEALMGVLNLTYASEIKLTRHDFKMNFQDFKSSVENLCLYVKS